tara:strand:+ start:39662 stop:39835 length:174 start_codon:yes stop_codon:yes gene_type:complete
MNEEVLHRYIHNYIKDNLTLDVSEESSGFNGRQLEFTLKIKDDVLSTELYTLKRDEG